MLEIKGVWACPTLHRGVKDWAALSNKDTLSCSQTVCRTGRSGLDQIHINSDQIKRNVALDPTDQATGHRLVDVAEDQGFCGEYNPVSAAHRDDRLTTDIQTTQLFLPNTRSCSPRYTDMARTAL